MSKFVNLEQIKVLANKVKSEDAALGTKLETVTTKVDNLVAAGGEADGDQADSDEQEYYGEYEPDHFCVPFDNANESMTGEQHMKPARILHGPA